MCVHTYLCMYVCVFVYYILVTVFPSLVSSQALSPTSHLPLFYSVTALCTHPLLLLSHPGCLCYLHTGVQCGPRMPSVQQATVGITCSVLGR